MPMNQTDYVRKNVFRTLPVELNDHELLDIARAKAKKEVSIAKLQTDLANETSKRRAAIKEQQTLVDQMTHELATGKQLREVKTDELVIDGLVHVIRQDTNETVEKRPLTMLEQQRRLPGTGEPPPNVLDEARKKQADAEADGDSTATKRVRKPRKGK